MVGRRSRPDLTSLVAAGRVDAVREALAAGASPHPDGGLAPVYFARDAAMIDALLGAGADPDVATEAGETALTHAAHDGALDLVEALLRGGASPDAPADAWPPLFYAAMAGHLDVVEALVRAGADLERVHDDRTALTLAADHRRWGVVSRLVAAAPRLARLGLLDPAGLARLAGEAELAERIAALRWSEPDGGLRGRLRIDPSTARTEGLRVTVELENVGDEERSVLSHTPLAFEWELWTEEARVPAPIGAVDVLASPTWSRLVPGARIELAASSHAGRRAALDLVTQVWPRLTARRHYLRGRYVVAARDLDDAPADARPLRLDLPSCLVPPG